MASSVILAVVVSVIWATLVLCFCSPRRRRARLEYLAQKARRRPDELLAARGVLDLSSCNLDDRDAVEVAQLLCTNTSITGLDLRGNEINTEGWCAIFDALRGRPRNKIAKWDLRGVFRHPDWGMNCMNPAIAKSLAGYMAASVSLTEVNLDGFALPIKKLKGKDPVDSLDFSNCGLGHASAVVIGSLIRGNASLTECNLRDNKLGDEGVESIATALKESTTSKLQNLNLLFNLIGPKGAAALASYVAVSASLTTLDVRHNGIMGDEGEAAILEAVRGKKGFELLI